MTAVAYRPLDDCEHPSPLRQGRGLLDPQWVPCALPHPRRTHDPATGRPPSSAGVLSVLFRILYWWLRIGFDRRFRASRMPVTAREAARELAGFQGFWFDAGLLLSQRSELFPPEVRASMLRHCRPSASLRFDEVRTIVEQELGSPLRLIFSEFEEVPARVGMYADSYRATLRVERVDVLVKVQRPGLERRLKRDLRVFRFIAGILRRAKASKRMIWDDAIDTFEERMPALLDLRFEASAMRRMRKALREHKVYVPRLFRDYSSKCLLVQEYLDAPTLQEWIDFREADPLGAEGWLVANDIDLRKTGRRLYNSMLRQICEDNLFQQDLGPGNVVLLRDSRFALLSCDATATVDKRFLSIFNLAVAAMMRDDYEKFTDTLFLLCDELPTTDLGGLRSDILRAVRSYAARSILGGATHQEKSLFVLTGELAQLLIRNEIVLDWQVLKVMSAMGSTDDSISAMHPAMNHRKELERYAMKAAGRRLRSVLHGGVGRAVSDVVSPLTEMLRFETASMRKRAQSFRASTGKVAYVFAAITRWVGRGIIAASLVGIWVFLHQHHFHVLAPFHDTEASEAARRVDHIHYGWWLIIFIAAFVGYRIARDIARRLAAREVNLQNATGPR